MCYETDNELLFEHVLNLTEVKHRDLKRKFDWNVSLNEIKWRIP